MTPPRELRTARLLLRPIDDGDAEAHAALNADARVMEHFPAPMSRAESEASLARMKAHRAEHGFGVWAVELPGEAAFIGIVGLFVPSFEAAFMPCVEVLWRLSAAHWGRGYASEAARASLDFGFEHLGLEEILAWTSPLNGASLRVMEKIGMRRDPSRDFEHPRVPVGHRLRQHVVYRAGRGDSREQQAGGTSRDDSAPRAIGWGDWFESYVDRLQHASVFAAPAEGVRYACPCCGYLTLGERGGFEICPVCFWEDDGQDEHDAGLVRGGPNGALSLAKARSNFREVGACELRHREDVRAPLPDEIPAGLEGVRKD